MAHDPKTKMVIASRRTEAAAVQQAVLDAAERHGYSREAIFGIRLALDEALNNAIRHGNCDDPDKHVTVEFSASDKRLSITVTDEGCGFCPEDVPDPTLDENLTRPCGRGVMLMQAYMNKVRFNKAGNRVTMVKEKS